jgi:hypothetical protein
LPNDPLKRFEAPPELQRVQSFDEKLYDKVWKVFSVSATMFLVCWLNT